MRLNQAEAQAMGMSTSLLRVHDELSKVARERMIGEQEIPTDVPKASTAIEEMPTQQAMVEHA